MGDLKTPLPENMMPSQAGLSDSDIKIKKKKRTYFQNLKKLVKSKLYLVGTFTMSVILFVSTGIQFWLTDYYENVMNFDADMVRIAYVVVSLTGPTSGCAFGT